MGTPKSIRTSLQQGGMGNVHRLQGCLLPHPNNPQSRKYLRFQSYQFKALQFGLSTAPMGFRAVVKEVKLMAQNKGVRIHIPSRLSPAYPDLNSPLSGWVVNIKKSELNGFSVL